MARRKRSKNNYFTRVHQEAIVEYALTKDRGVRTTLYINLIEPAFDEMVNKIVYTYKFTNLPNIDYLKDECKIWLTTILDKFDPEKGSKAFSYFSVITKNWFIHKVKKNNRSLKREVHYDDVNSDDVQQYMTVENTYMEKRMNAEFWLLFWKEVNQWEKTLKLKENEKKVLEAIKMLFSQAEDIEIFNKKAIYLYMREITGLNTKQIVNNLNKMRKKYTLFKQKWDEGLM